MINLAGISIVAIDDEYTMVQLVGDVLSECGAFVYATTDPGQTMDYIQIYRPDILLLDWNMPGMTGIEVLKAVRANPETQDVSVIMLTGAKKDTEVQEAIKAGVDGYVTKPFAPTALLKQITVVLKKRGNKWFVE